MDSEDCLFSGHYVLISVQDMITPEFSILHKPVQTPQHCAHRNMTDASQQDGLLIFTQQFLPFLRKIIFHCQLLEIKQMSQQLPQIFQNWGDKYPNDI